MHFYRLIPTFSEGEGGVQFVMHPIFAFDTRTEKSMCRWDNNRHTYFFGRDYGLFFAFLLVANLRSRCLWRV